MKNLFQRIKNKLFPEKYWYPFGINKSGLMKGCWYNTSISMKRGEDGQMYFDEIIIKRDQIKKLYKK